jgi:hypothetical protein
MDGDTDLARGHSAALRNEGGDGHMATREQLPQPPSASIVADDSIGYGPTA